MTEINDKNFVDVAEQSILELKNLKNKNGKPKGMVTTSKIRNLLAMTSEIYNDVVNNENDDLTDDIKARIEYLRIRFVYEAGREETVKDFVKTAKILDVLKNTNGTKKGYVFFNRYMEALVAFHKYHGGKDK